MPFKVDGMDDHLAEMAALESAIDDACERNLNRLGNDWLSQAQDLTPWDTGKLKQGFRFDGAKKRGKAWEINIYNNTEYAAPIEFGHRIVDRNGVDHGWYEGFYMLGESGQRVQVKALPEALRRIVKEVRDGHKGGS